MAADDHHRVARARRAGANPQRVARLAAEGGHRQRDVLGQRRERRRKILYRCFDFDDVLIGHDRPPSRTFLPRPLGIRFSPV